VELAATPKLAAAAAAAAAAALIDKDAGLILIKTSSQRIVKLLIKKQAGLG